MSKSINHLATADGLFFGKGGLDQRRTAKMVDEALAGCDDGELFLEYEQSESLSFDDGKLKSASYDTTQGFGLRSVAGEATGFAHASALDEAALKRAVATVKAVRTGKSGKLDESPRGTNHLLYADDNPIDGEAFAKKVALLETIDAYVRDKEPKARQVSISMAASWQVVEIIRAGGWRAADVRPLVRLNVSVVCADGSRMEIGRHGQRPARRLRRPLQAGALAARGRRGDPPGAGQPAVGPGARRRDAGRAGAGLVGRAVARGGRPRAGGRLPSQEDLGLHPDDGRHDRLARRHRGR